MKIYECVTGYMLEATEDNLRVLHVNLSLQMKKRGWLARHYRELSFEQGLDFIANSTFPFLYIYQFLKPPSNVQNNRILLRNWNRRPPKKQYRVELVRYVKTEIKQHTPMIEGYYLSFTRRQLYELSNTELTTWLEEVCLTPPIQESFIKETEEV